MITRRQIEELSNRIAKRFHPEKIVLFGSYASGQPTEDSDVDLLVVMPFSGRSVDQAVEMRMEARPSFPVDFIVRIVCLGGSQALRPFWTHSVRPSII